MTEADTSAVDGLLPLTPASFQILLVLATGPTHGYSIMIEVDRMTDHVTQLGPGTLYRTIQKLLGDELIAVAGADDDERRVPYRITARGLAVARAEARRLAALVDLARARKLLPASTLRRASAGTRGARS
jgi:DNA-binding PadR family transcriptional regulator